MKRRSKPARAVGRIIFALTAVAGAVTSAAALSVVTASAASAATPSPAATVSYSATESFPLGGGSRFTDASGDGWDTALSSTQVFNVFHHQSVLQVDCHDQSTGASCWGHPKTITDGSDHNFATSNLPGLYLDQASGHLFVYAVRTSDDSAGVVCIDTTQLASASGAQLFCGYTRLTSANQAPFVSYAGVSNPAQVGSNWYAFNEVAGTGTGDENELLCFNLISDAACVAQPFVLDFGGGPLATFTNPHPIAAIGNEVIVPVVGTSGDELACFNGATNTSCSDSWPVSITDAEGAPFPLLNSSGSEIGICLPTAGDPCFSFTGTAVATPAGMTAAIGSSYLANGQAVVLGTRVYVPNWETTQVDCYDSASHASCPDFPKTMNNLGGLYTVRLDPLRPDCIWVNADHGSAQIQNFDALTGGDCPSGPIRVNASSFVAPYNRCLPTNFTSLQVIAPARDTYASGTVEFEQPNGTPIPGLPTQQIDTFGNVNLAPFGLTTKSALPQFAISLNGETEATGQLTVKLTWTGNKASQCTSGGQKITTFDGYWLDASDGGIFSYGAANFYGSTGSLVLNRPMVGMAPSPDHGGYWLVASDGGIFAFGDANFYGSTGSLVLNRPVVGMASTPDGGGYWLVASDGGLFAFGDANFYGSTGSLTLNRPIVGMAPTPDGRGYWLVASDGGIFSFGDASFYGSTGSLVLNKPIEGMASSPDGFGYWLVASDGGIFAFGDAGFYGSTGSLTLNKPIVGMASTPDGRGYWLDASDGGVFAFGDAAFYGSAGNLTLNKPMVGMAT
ncbi:MAG: WD40 repeat domain-containing protein [Acidimicrobiales bacterium]